MAANLLKKQRWSPYLAGALIGALSWVTFAVMDKALGVSTTPVRVLGGVERTVAPTHEEGLAYLTKYAGTAAEPKAIIDWQFALVVMMIAGAFIAARLAGPRVVETVPAIWKERFGSSKALRYALAFVGGMILIFGARLAGGCTSGHGLSGGMQLSLSGWVFMIAMFAGGVPAALILYGRKGCSACADSNETTHDNEGSAS
ncbi:MAG: YeeE/YedE family protein [Phycisphaerales bacterium]|nr:YeeE/YedE family protein [Phycisphaerales bacterium]